MIGIVQLRDGIVPLLDTVTYWSGAEAVASGRPFTTNLAPSFTNFDAVDFLGRGGRLPFVDFPVGYPVVAGVIGAAIGVRAAMQILVVAALAAVATLVVLGGRTTTSHDDHDDGSRSIDTFRLGWLAALGVALIALPTTRLVTQGVLSETLFCASAIALVVALAKYRQGGHWWPVALLTVTTSLLRFIGAPLAMLAGWEHWRRTGDKRGSIGRTILLMIPAGSNIVLASAFGGGHNAGWRGLDRLDVDVFTRSVGGWLDSRQGDLRRTYFTGEGPAWWAWIVTALWLIGLFVVLVGYLRGLELAAAYASADAFIFPSRTETLGLVLLEAMAAGCPVVAANAGGIPDIVTDGVNGFLFDPTDEQGAVTATQRLFADPSQRADLRSAARAEAERWGWAAATRQLKDYYYGILSMSQRQAA